MLGIAVACAYTKSPIEKAWARAQKLAKVTEAESKDWPKPTVSIVYQVRYIPTGPGTATRVCGRTQPYLTGNPPDDIYPIFDIFAFVRQTGEGPLLVDILTHEFLHVIWFERDIHAAGWEEAHPDNEEWVQSLLPNTCPMY
jgi:hypothetical protein